MDNIPLVEDLFVHIMELMIMKKQDLEAFRAVFALYTISYCADVSIGEIEECDLPDPFREGYRAVRSSLSELVDDLEQYCKDKTDAFMSACED